ncbi:hypothetical protein D3C72_2400820 [compost metagenome]
MLLHGEAPAQRILGQPVDGDGAQVVFLELQQRDGPAAKVGAQAGHQPLQADGGGKVGDQVGKQQVLHGWILPSRGE